MLFTFLIDSDLINSLQAPNDWPGDNLPARLRQIKPEVTIDQGTGTSSSPCGTMLVLNLLAEGSILIRLPPPTAGQIVRVVAEDAPNRSTRPRQKVKQVKVRAA